MASHVAWRKIVNIYANLIWVFKALSKFKNLNFDFSFFKSLTLKVSGSGGESIDIRGVGFGTDPNVISVKIGGIPCIVTSAIDTKITCTLGDGEGGPAEIQVRT